MTNQELQTLLQNMDKKDLEYLQYNLSYYYEQYLNEMRAIDNMQRQVDICEQEKTRDPKPGKRELDILENLNLAKQLPKKGCYKIEGKLNESHKIDRLIIGGEQFNTSTLDSQDYAKLFFKKAGHDLPNAILFLLISILLISVGLVTRMPLLNTLGVISLIPSILNFVNYVTNDTLENNLKRRISRRQIKVFTKKLAKDYEKEKINSQKFHEQNLIFNESRQGIFRASLEMHLENRNIITEEIKSVLSSYLPSLTEELDSSSESLSEEELNNVQTVVEGYQKTLKQ